ncbi:MAG: hypothetical protein ACRDF9_07375 [Candidatus Limnocylindria bacterium]
MRALVAGFGALLIAATTSCADQANLVDQGNLMIRCPDARGAIPVNDGQVTIDAVVMRVGADLSVPAAPDEGMTFVIDLQFPDSPGAASPSVQCVRMRLEGENLQWDAVPRRIDEHRDGSHARVRSTGRDGPHWRLDDLVDVTIWLKTASGRHVLTLSRQPIHRPV